MRRDLRRPALRTIGALVLVTAACTSTQAPARQAPEPAAPAGPPPVEPPAEPPESAKPPAQPASPLVLELAVRGRASARSGELPPFEATIRNAGDAPRNIVVPGDGSTGRVREPHVWWTGEYDPGGGAWRPMTKREQPGCGMYDERWHDEIVAVAPGAKQPLMPWIGAPDHEHDMTAPGRYRVRMHYAYTAGAGAQTEFDPGAMADAAPFELESNPVEITVTPAR